MRDYAGLLELGEGYTVAELEVEETDWIAGRELGELTLRDAGIVVLGIHSPGRAPYVGAPEGSTTVCPGDVLTVYGLEERVEALDRGRAAAAVLALQVDLAGGERVDRRRPRRATSSAPSSRSPPRPAAALPADRAPGSASRPRSAASVAAGGSASRVSSAREQLRQRARQLARVAAERPGRGAQLLGAARRGRARR